MEIFILIDLWFMLWAWLLTSYLTHCKWTLDVEDVWGAIKYEFVFHPVSGFELFLIQHDSSEVN